jgi:hypothetical protein
MFVEFPCGRKCLATLLTFVLIGLCHASHLLSFGSDIQPSNRYAADPQHIGQYVVAGMVDPEGNKEASLRKNKRR